MGSIETSERRQGGVGEVLRSITPWSAGLAGGLAIAMPILAATIYEMKFGRPSSTAAVVIPFAFIWGGLAAAVGAAIGMGVQQRIARTRWAGPSNPRVVAGLLVLAATIPSALAIYAVRNMEDENAPRVIRSTGEVSRAEGSPASGAARSAAFLWVGLPHPDHPTAQLQWNGRPVDLRVADGRLIVSGEVTPGSTIDISDFDYAREVYGVTARLAGTDREWLALLVQLRATGRRELLLIFNPEGRLVHEELLERQTGRVPHVGLATAGPAGGRQEIVVDRGVPMRYYVSAR